MRYELDNEGYVLNVYFGCYGENCVEYEGNIPNGYTSLVEWSEKANINAYYIKDNNLTYDAQRDKEICKQQELDTEENAYATKGYVNSKLNVSSTIYDDNMTKTTNDLVIKDAGEYEIPEIVIEGAGDLKTSTNKIEDARAGKSQGIKIEGKSYQETRSGKNIVKKVTTSTKKTQYGNVMYIEGNLKANTTYALSLIGTKDNEVYVNENVFSAYKYLHFDGTRQSLILTTKDGLNENSYGAYEKDNGWIILKNAIDQPNDNVFIDVQLEEGSTATEYEPYGVSPSPDYPSEIKNIEGVTNYFDATKYISTSGVEVVSNTNGVLELKGISGYYAEVTQQFNLVPNNEYSISYYGEEIDTSVDSKAYVRVRDINNNNLITPLIRGEQKATFICPNDGVVVINFRVNGETNKGHVKYSNIQLVEGSITHDYVPYGRWLEVKSNNKNLLEPIMATTTANGITCTNNGDGSFTLNGTATANVDFRLDQSGRGGTDNLKTYNGTYTLSCDELVEGVNFWLTQLGTWKTALNLNADKKSASGNVNNMSDMFMYVGVVSGTTLNNLVIKPMLEKSTEKTSYEPYKENTALVDMNKRDLFKDGSIRQGRHDSSLATNRVSYISNTFYPKGTTFTIKNNSSLICGVAIVERQSQDCNLLDDSGWLSKKIYTFTSTSDGYLTINMKKSDDSNITPSVVTIDDFKIYKGIETDSYYRLASIGDIKDTFKDGLYTQRIGKVVLDGSENWDYVSGSTTFYTTAITDYATSNNIPVSNCYNGITNVSGSGSMVGQANNTIAFINVSGETTPRFYLKDTRYTTVGNLKTWLSNNPIEVEYILATPIEHTLNYEILELHEGYNNITTNDDLEPNVNVTYIAQKTTLEDGLKVQVSNDNQLVNQVLNHSTNGLEVEVNEDKSITINGTATADTEIVLNGSNENVEPIFMLNDKNTFTLSGLTDDITLNLYNYDGTNKTLLFSGTSGEVNIEGTQYVTYSTLSIASGVKVNTTITPMITANNEEYVAAKLNDILDIDINELQQYEKIKIDRNYVSLVNDVTKVETILDVIDGVNTYDPITLIQTNQDRLELTTKYFPNDYLNKRFAEVKVEQDSIRSEVSATYITKVDSDKNISTAKTEAINSANSSTDEKLENYSTTEEINASLELKINKDDLVSEINAKANVITLTSDNFKLDANGKITATSGKIGGWEIGKNYLYSDYSDGTYDYRAYLQPILSQSGAETWVYSIQKKKTNDTNYTGVYYVQADGTIYTDGTIHAEGCIETPSYILANDSIQSNTGFFTGKSYLAPNGAYVEKQLVVDGNVVTPYLATAKKDALNICGYGGSAIGGEKGLWLSTENNITLNPISGGAYVRIGDGSSYKISTAGGNVSSLSLKENLEEFKEEDYNDAIDLLREIDLYNFDYKYDINSYENNYGFIIDYIKENDKSNKFFNFNQYKAVVNKNKTLDEAKAQEEPDNENIIEYERYSEESLVKYLLTVCKAQQQQIDELKESIKALN